MLNLDLLVDLSEETEEEQQVTAGEGPLLAAVLAAALVEYRRCVECHDTGGSINSGGANWRTIARLEQLRSRA